MKAVISDSSTLITLLNIQKINLLFNLFESIKISKTVYDEVTMQLYNDNEIDNLIKEKKIIVKSVPENELFKMLIKRLDLGESQSIALAKESKSLLIIDEYKGRSIANSLNMNIIGLIGIVLQLLKMHKLTKKEAENIIYELEKKDFKISNALKELIVK